MERVLTADKVRLSSKIMVITKTPTCPESSCFYIQATVTTLAKDTLSGRKNTHTHTYCTATVCLV